jgi:tRNA nucleotidyltransferase/poly(A) polymerase
VSLQDQVVGWLAEQDVDAYLVGGYVRDTLLRRDIVYDLDVAVAGDGLPLARSLADRFHGDYYPLDLVRRIGRAILHRSDSEPLVVDLAQLRGPDLEADLADRDFTVNALAMDARSPSSIIDFHGGLADLHGRLIRPVTPDSIRNDPLRALRAVRLAAQLRFSLTPEAVAAIRRDGAGLAEISGERIRDELARLLGQTFAYSFLVELERLGLLFLCLPELEPLRGLTQSLPHHLDVLHHSLKTVQSLEEILVELPAGVDPRPSVNLHLLGGLERFADRISLHLLEPLSGKRSRLVALKLAALLHDVGKPDASEVDGEGNTRFIGHERESVRIAGGALHRLRFSGREVRVVETIIRNHMRPLLLAKQEVVTRRAVYRFFRASGEAGIDTILHALADHRATYAPGTGEREWRQLLSVAARMLGDYWDYRSERVSPKRLLTGHDLMSEFGLQPGPKIGELLEAVQEALAIGQLHTRDEAKALVRSLLESDEEIRQC